MTVLNDNPPAVQYIGDGATTFFAYTFEVKSYSDILVSVDDVPTAFVRDATGVTIDPAPVSLSVVALVRSTSVDQLTDFTAQEAFPPLKTEDAVDKLILLKQEIGFFNAQMNLQSQPFLSNVTLVNDVGTDAKIPLWDTLTGMFSGLVSTTIPAAGTVVDKPLDFVYMQYGGDEELQTLTTTIYPLEAAEALQLSIALAEAELQPIPEDVVDLVPNFISAEMFDIQISGGPYDDAVDLNPSMGDSFQGATLTQVVIFTGPFDDAVDLDHGFFGAIMEDKLVKVYAPDEALQLSIALDEGAWTLTPV
jgi:hypothetical protein